MKSYLPQMAATLGVVYLAEAPVAFLSIFACLQSFFSADSAHADNPSMKTTKPLRRREAELLGMLKNPHTYCKKDLAWSSRCCGSWPLPVVQWRLGWECSETLDDMGEQFKVFSWVQFRKILTHITFCLLWLWVTVSCCVPTIFVKWSEVNTLFTLRFPE